MEREDGELSHETGGIVVTPPPQGYSQRTDEQILDELADVARRLRPNRLADLLEPDTTSPEPGEYQPSSDQPTADGPV